MLSFEFLRRSVVTKYMKRLPSSVSSTATAATLTVIALAAFFHAGMYEDAVIDDAFITFRHAQNIVRGFGFTCNPHERIEGTSSFLMTLLMIIPVFLHLDPLAFAQLVGRFAFSGCAVLAFFAVRSCLNEPIGIALGIAAAAMTASFASAAFHSQSGLETPLYSFFLALGLLYYLRRFVSNQDPSSSKWALVMGLASITRPEGFAFFGVLFVAALFKQSRSQPNPRAALRDLVVFFAIFGTVTVFRRLYFGVWLPNPVLAKSGTVFQWEDFHPSAILSALGYLGGADYHPFFAAEAICAIAGIFSILTKPTRFAGIAANCLFLGCAAVVMWNGKGSDWMPYHRLMIPSVVPLAVAAALGLRGLLFHPDQSRAVSVLFASVLCVAVIGFASRPLRVDVFPTPYAQIREIGEHLANTRLDDDVVVSDMGGILPYFWGIQTIDMMGLCDAYLARHGRLFVGIGRFDAFYATIQEPTFFVFTYPVGAATFFKTAAFAPYRNQYYLVKWPWQYYRDKKTPITLLVRKNRPKLTEFRQILGVKLLDPESEFRRTGFIQGVLQ